MAGNRVAAGSYTDLQNPAEFSPKLEREAHMELQYRPHIVDTDTIVGAVCHGQIDENWVSMGEKWAKKGGFRKGGFRFTVKAQRMRTQLERHRTEIFTQILSALKPGILSIREEKTA